MVVVAQVTVVLVLTVCWLVSLLRCFTETFVYIFRVTEFNAGGCLSDWGERQCCSMTDGKSIHHGHPLIRPEDLSQTVNVYVLLSLYRVIKKFLCI
jgi:hypothetical protein